MPRNVSNNYHFMKIVKVHRYIGRKDGKYVLFVIGAESSKLQNDQILWSNNVKFMVAVPESPGA